MAEVTLTLDMGPALRALDMLGHWSQADKDRLAALWIEAEDRGAKLMTLRVDGAKVVGDLSQEFRGMVEMVSAGDANQT